MTQTDPYRQMPGACWLPALGLGIIAIAVVAHFLWQEWQIAGAWGFPLDDTWIHLQFARNLSERGEFSFNPGQPLSASTSPLWTLFLALIHLMPCDVIWAVKAVGLLLLWTCGVLTLLLAHELGLKPHWALLAGGVVVLTPRLIWGSLSGMEVMFYATLATAGLLGHVRSLNRPPALWGTTCFALATLARPECAMLFPLAILDRWRICRDWRTLWRLYRHHALVFGLILTPFLTFNLLTLGKWLPNTYYAKVGVYGLPGALVAGDWVRIGKTVLFYPLIQMQEIVRFGVENHLILAFFVPFGMGWFLFSGQNTSRSLLLPMVLIAFPILRGILAPFQGATFQHGRYVAHLVPVLTIAGLLGLQGCWEFIRDRYQVPAQWLHRAYRVAFLLILWNALAMNLQYARTYGQDVENIQTMHVQMGQWLAQNTPSDAVIATHDIGAIGYFSGRRILDTVGLVTPEVLPFINAGKSVEEGVLAFLEHRKPDYLVVMPNWYPRLTIHPESFRPIHEITLTRVTIAAGNRLVVYQLDWEK